LFFCFNFIKNHKSDFIDVLGMILTIQLGEGLRPMTRLNSKHFLYYLIPTT